MQQAQNLLYRVYGLGFSVWNFKVARLGYTGLGFKMSKGITFQTLDPQEGTGFGLGLRV